MEDNAEIMHKYVEALEEERRKIQVFHRELPLCVELVTKAIDAYRQQLTTTIEYLPGRSECSEQTSSDSQAIVEFIPIKRSFSSEEEESHKPKSTERNDKVGKKTDWLRSAQLWNQDPDPSPKQDQTRNTSSGTETKKSGGAFHPSQRETGVTATSAVRTPLSTQTAATSSTSADTVNGGSGRREEKEGQSHRKARRCWSPELHRRFLNALQQLGGTHAATPKQIRELMKVDGLTNDEVKSHLQKYRLHTRRPSQPIHNNSNPQPPQFVVMGGVWVPAPEYATGPATTGETNGVAANGVYAPVAVPPQASMLCSQQQQQQQQQEQKQLQQSPLHSEEKGSRSVEDDNTRSNSPATSSSTHTTTASHAF